MQNPLARRQRLRLYAFLAFALALSVLAVTKTLPYASFLMANTDTGEEASDPSRGFFLGSVRWEVEQFSRAQDWLHFGVTSLKDVGPDRDPSGNLSLSGIRPRISGRNTDT